MVIRTLYAVCCVWLAQEGPRDKKRRVEHARVDDRLVEAHLEAELREVGVGGDVDITDAVGGHGLGEDAQASGLAWRMRE